MSALIIEFPKQEQRRPQEDSFVRDAAGVAGLADDQLREFFRIIERYTLERRQRREAS